MLGKVLRTISLLLLAGLAAAETIPAGAHITVRIDSAISSGTARTGQAFHGNLTRNLVVNGKTIAREGARFGGKLPTPRAADGCMIPACLRFA